MDSIFPLSYRKGINFWHIFASSGLKVATINVNLANPEKLAKIIVNGANKEYQEKSI
jgi:hypothetical protein